MKKIMSTLSILAVVVGYCIGQEVNIGDTDGCNNSKLGDELYGILYADDEEQYIQGHQHIAVDTLGLDISEILYVEIMTQQRALRNDEFLLFQRTDFQKSN